MYSTLVIAEEVMDVTVYGFAKGGYPLYVAL
jgi:hypothetical protein